MKVTSEFTGVKEKDVVYFIPLYSMWWRRQRPKGN